MAGFYAGKGVKDDQEALALVIRKIHESKEELKNATKEEPFFTLQQCYPDGTLTDIPPKNYTKREVLMDSAIIGNPTQVKRVGEHVHLVYHGRRSKPEAGTEYRLL